MKKVLLLCLFVMLALTGCMFYKEESYTFRQSFDQITSIEILKRGEFVENTTMANRPMSIMKTLDETEYQDMIDAILSADGGRNGLISTTTCGSHIIRITYKDGEVEMLGCYNNGYVSVDGTWRPDCYTFDKEEFYAIISGFLGEEIKEPTLG